jgi:hypothetical protein
MPHAADLDGPVSQRFEELWQKWPRRVQRDRAARNWVSYVTAANEHEMFACADRYFASDEVSRGVVMDLHNWLERQYRGGWADEWPPARERRGPPNSRDQRRQAEIDRSWQEVSNGTREG